MYKQLQNNLHKKLLPFSSLISPFSHLSIVSLFPPPSLLPPPSLPPPPPLPPLPPPPPPKGDRYRRMTVLFGGRKQRTEDLATICKTPKRHPDCGAGCSLGILHCICCRERLSNSKELKNDSMPFMQGVVYETVPQTFCKRHCPKCLGDSFTVYTVTNCC